MTLARVGYNQSGEQSGGVASITRTVAAGNLLVAITRGAHNFLTLEDSQFNAYAPASANVTDGLENLRIYATKATASGSNTVTFSLEAATYCFLSVWEFSGQHATTYIDNSAGLVVTDGSAAGTLTTAVSGCLIVAAAKSTAGYLGAGSGYTAEADYSFQYYCDDEYQLDVGAAGSKSVSFGSAGSIMAAAAFRPAAGGGGGKPAAYYFNMMNN